MELRAYVEAAIDFPDEDIAPDTKQQLLSRLERGAGHVPLPRLPMWIWQEPAATLTEEPHVLPPLEAGPLPEEVKVEVHRVHLEASDTMLLCSDGLTEMVPEEEINHILQTEAEPEKACRRLVTHANEAGGKDNVSVVLLRYTE